MTFGLPLLAPVILFAEVWAMPGTFPIAAGLPILSLILAYIYFPLALVRRRLFTTNNALKSVLLGLVGFEIYRQVVLSAYKAFGFSVTALIQQHCGRDVETLQAAFACSASAYVSLFWSSLVFWLFPAALLLSVSRHRTLTPLERGEA
jgi:hypothetical protein